MLLIYVYQITFKKKPLMIKLNRTTKFFLYGLILVVIAVLLNLQVQNWNEARKAAVEEEATTKSIENAQ